ncbi:MAG: efflux RND transporter periplasmic adaptor subunit [Aestuariibacter sp.]
MSVIPAPLRDDVKVRKLVQQGECSYVLKEPDKQAYFRFSEPQYQLIELFDGVHDISQIVDKFNEESELYEFDVEAAESVFNACKDYQVLKRTKQEENAALLERIKEERKKSLLQAKGSVLMMRFQLVNPNELFDRVIDSLRFFWHPTALRIQASFIALALLIIVFNADRFVQDFSQVYLQTQFSGVLYIWIIALCAIALHECGHGLTCKYYGGDVHEMGFLLLAFQPCLYCNVNDAWLFENKQHKIQVALAGVWVEMLLAATATIVWLLVDVNNPVGYVAFVLMTIGTASSLFVNLNPLLKFDGYYILTDWLEMQNLRQNALAWFSWNLKVWLFNSDEEKPFTPSEKEKRVYWLYGTLVVIYMTLMLSFIAWIGYQFMYAQFGFLAIIGFIYLIFRFLKSITGTWLSVMMQFLKNHLWSTQQTKIRTLAGVFVLLLISIFYSPPILLKAEGEVSSELVTIYAPTNAYIDEVHYDESRRVVADDNGVVINMRSPQLNLLIQELSSKLKQLETQKVTASIDSDSASLARLAIEISLIQEQLISARKTQQQLFVRKPRGEWSVDGLPPDMLQGRFFSQEQEVIRLVSDEQRFFDAIVDQRDVSYLKVGDEALIRLNADWSKIYRAEVQSISALAKASGVEQKVKVRTRLINWEKNEYLPIGLTGETKLYGAEMPLWQHAVFNIRKFFRADLWL